LLSVLPQLHPVDQTHTALSTYIAPLTHAQETCTSQHAQETCMSVMLSCTSFYRAMHYSAKHGIAITCRPSMMLVDCDHIGWKLVPRFPTLKTNCRDN